MADLKTYRGNCHCTAFVYEIKVPEIKSVAECNCSICSRKGYLWVFPGKDNFKVVKGSVEELSCYTFEPQSKEHRFCGNCGTGILAREIKDGKVAINVHALQDIDTWSLEKKPFDGKAQGSPFKPHPHNGPLPELQVENGKQQTGSCHCGKLTLAVNVPVVDSTYPDKILECNCSICERNGYIWIYPLVPQVVLTASSPSDLGAYHFAREILDKTFCKTCGVPMTNRARPISDEKYAALSEFDRSWVPVITERHAVNVRVLEGLDLGALPERERSDARKWPPVYANP